MVEGGRLSTGGTGEIGGTGNGADISGVGISVQGWNAAIGPVVLYMPSFVVLTDGGGGLAVSIGNGCESPFWVMLTPLLDESVSICCKRAAVI